MYRLGLGSMSKDREGGKVSLRHITKIIVIVRGRAEKEPRISIPVPAVPVSELLAGKAREFVIL